MADPSAGAAAAPAAVPVTSASIGAMVVDEPMSFPNHASIERIRCCAHLCRTWDAGVEVEVRERVGAKEHSPVADFQEPEVDTALGEAREAEWRVAGDVEGGDDEGCAG